MIVHILIAHNGADFDAEDIIVAATSEEKAEEKLHMILHDQWTTANVDDIEFYETEEKYIEAWNINIEQRELYE